MTTIEGYAPGVAFHPVISLIRDRLAEKSARGERSDGRVLALGIEGGGVAGAVSGEMCVMLEEAKMVNIFDVIYGTSSGALNGLYVAAGKSKMGSANYQDTVSKDFFNPFRHLRGKPILSLDFLFEEVVKKRRPLSETDFRKGPDFRALGVNLISEKLEVLKDFKDLNEALEAVRVSCSIPFFSGTTPLEFRGTPMSDGALLESMPYNSAINEGATDVLVLRSKKASYRKKAESERSQKILKRFVDPRIAEMIIARPAAYNETAKKLIELSASDSHVFQVVPAESSYTVQRFDRSIDKINAGKRAGAAAMHQLTRLIKNPDC